jgi:hypothetical protein
VLLARPSFLSRLEDPSLSFLKPALAGQFRFDEIGEDESIDFLRHQIADRAYLTAKSAATAPSANALKRRDTMWLEVFIRPNEAIAEVSWKRICAIVEAPLRLPWPRSAS